MLITWPLIYSRSFRICRGHVSVTHHIVFGRTKSFRHLLDRVDGILTANTLGHVTRRCDRYMRSRCASVSASAEEVPVVGRWIRSLKLRVRHSNLQLSTAGLVQPS